MVVRRRVVGIKDSSKTVVRKSDTGQHLQLKSSIKGALGGHQNVLNRAISCLTVEYRVSDKKDQEDKAAFMLWNFIQSGESWVLVDQLSSSQLFSLNPASRPSQPNA
jgi:hypothetical protein